MRSGKIEQDTELRSVPRQRTKALCKPCFSLWIAQREQQAWLIPTNFSRERSCSTLVSRCHTQGPRFGGGWQEEQPSSSASSLLSLRHLSTSLLCGFASSSGVRGIPAIPPISKKSCGTARSKRNLPSDSIYFLSRLIWEV